MNASFYFISIFIKKKLIIKAGDFINYNKNNFNLNSKFLSKMNNYVLLFYFIEQNLYKFLGFYSFSISLIIKL